MDERGPVAQPDLHGPEEVEQRTKVAEALNPKDRWGTPIWAEVRGSNPRGPAIHLKR
jgi:hypothetical protein